MQEKMFRMSFPELATFLRSCFEKHTAPDGDDVQLARIRLEERGVDLHRLEDIVAEYEKLLRQREFPWRQVADRVKRNLRTEFQTREWLAAVMVAVREQHAIVDARMVAASPWRQFRRKYRNLWSLLGCSFVETDPAITPDAEAVGNELDGVGAKHIAPILSDYQALLEEDEFPWEQIADAANRLLQSEPEARAWLVAIMNVVQQRYDEALSRENNA